MRGAATIVRSSIGKKLLMAGSALILFAYVVGHLAGNLKIFFGPEPFNHYAEWLRIAGTPLFPDQGVLWIARIVLLAALFVHIGAYVQLFRRTRSARSQRYKDYDPQVFSYASRTMVWGGIAILLFVIYHLLHITWGIVHPDFIAGDPYNNVVIGFANVWVSLFYIVGVIALGLHLYHGTWSAMQTFGMSNPTYNRLRRPAALVIAWVITLGYLSIPLAVLLGIVG